MTRSSGIKGAAKASAALRLEPVERRQFGRRPCRIAGHVKARWLAPVACVVLDQSDGGAFLALDDPEALPQRITLAFPDQGIEIACDVRHRCRSGVGVQFLRGDVDLFRRTFGLAEFAADAPKTAPAVTARATSDAGRLDSVTLRRQMFRVVQGGATALTSVVRGERLRLVRVARHSGMTAGLLLGLIHIRTANGIEPVRRAGGVLDDTSRSAEPTSGPSAHPLPASP
jgi:hypothetical protein